MTNEQLREEIGQIADQIGKYVDFKGATAAIHLFNDRLPILGDDG